MSLTSVGVEDDVTGVDIAIAAAVSLLLTAVDETLTVLVDTDDFDVNIWVWPDVDCTGVEVYCEENPSIDECADPAPRHGAPPMGTRSDGVDNFEDDECPTPAAATSASKRKPVVEGKNCGILLIKLVSAATPFNEVGIPFDVFGVVMGQAVKAISV
jgi:hypothetical protein